ncbi:MAG: shikimate dehydrogenase [Chloroflexota bacterium]
MIELGLIGYPLEHSLSPQIHHAALATCGLKGRYTLFSISPSNWDKVHELLNQVRDGVIQGLNVTIPHKEAVIPLLDTITPIAEAIGAVNTIFMQEDKLIGDNTDAAGFLADLDNNFTGWRNESTKNALVLGAGGSARAVTSALIKEGWNVTITARRLGQVEGLIAQFPEHVSQLSSLEYLFDDLTEISPTLHLIINATPIGMWPNIKNSPWLEGLPYPKRAFFYDLVYNPHDTRFVLGARDAGLPAVTGFGMLVEQAALSFELWIKCSVPREKLFASLEEK